MTNLTQILGPKPPKSVGYAVEIGIVLLAVGLFGRSVKGPIDAVLRLADAILFAIILYWIYRMRRRAVWAYLLLTAVSAAIGLGIFGLAAWRGLVIGTAARIALITPSLYYWRRLV
jgi:hypothetical protein